MKTDIQLTPHFHLEEFLHPGADAHLTVEIVENLRRLAQRLETVRTQLGERAITITSGYRSPVYNQTVGGARRSQHLTGKAADIVVAGLSPKQVQAALKDWDGGLGFGKTFTHLDLGARRRWDYA